MGSRHLVSLLAALAWAPSAVAHGLDANRIELVVHDRVVEAVATPAAESVRMADDDGDGRISPAELRAHREEVRRSLVASLVVLDGNGTAGEQERSDVSVPRGDATDGVVGRDYVRLTVVLRWPTPPTALRVRCGFAGGHPVAVSAHRAEASSPGVLTLVGEPEYGSLSTPLAEVTLLDRRAPTVAPAPTTSRRAGPVSATTTTTPSAVVVLALAALAVLFTHFEIRKHS
jgi:hypothetical protein